MKIHGYRVEPRGQIALDAVLNHLQALPLAARTRTVWEVPMRLETAIRQGAYWLLDFAMIRREGPGRGSIENPITDFDLRDNEGFGEETAGCFHRASGFMTLQYNHRGPRHGRIQSYLFRFAQLLAGLPEGDDEVERDNGFTLLPILTAQAAARLDQMDIVKKIEMSFYVPRLAARAAHQRQSLGGFLELPLLGHAEKVKLEITASQRRGSSLNPRNIRRTVRELLGAREDLLSLNVVAKEADEDRGQAIDFLEERLVTDVSLVLRRGSRRYAKEDRFAELVRAFTQWRHDGLLE